MNSLGPHRPCGPRGSDGSEEELEESRREFYFCFIHASKLLKFTFISFLNTFRSSKQERKEALLRRMVPSSRSVVVSIRKTGAPVSHLFLFRNLRMSLKGQHRFNYMWLDHRKISRAFGFVQNSIRLKRAVEPR